MYLKLALRNAKRAAVDYLLYMLTIMILIAIMCISNCIANFGSMKMGFQTVSLPFLIVLIIVVLFDYMNTFMLRQRARELGIYTLLGIEKRKLYMMFFFELCIIGALCFLTGLLLGIGFFFVCFQNGMIGIDNQTNQEILLKSILQTLGYFVMIELISMICLGRKIKKLQIVQLMKENQRNQPLRVEKRMFWKFLFLISFLGFLVLLWGIAFGNQKLENIFISVISIPILCCVFAFYRWLYALISLMRLKKSDKLFRNNLLYLVGEITTGAKMNSTVNAVFCICLLFSAASFVVGLFMLDQNICWGESQQQVWMGFLQLSISVIFIVIYFFILSFIQMTEFKKQEKNMKILKYLGKNVKELKHLVIVQVLLKLLFPALMCFVLYGIATPAMNYKMNQILPTNMYNFLWNAMGRYIVCFLLLNMCYFFIVYNISKRSIETKFF